MIRNGKEMTDEDIDKMIRKRVERNLAKALKEREELQPLFNKLNRIAKQKNEKKHK